MEHTVRVSRARLEQLEKDRRINAGRRRIIARHLKAQGLRIAEIARLTGVSTSQAHKDLKGEEHGTTDEP